MTSTAPKRRWLRAGLGLLLVAVMAAGGYQAYQAWRLQHQPAKIQPPAPSPAPLTRGPGSIKQVMSIQTLTPAEVVAEAKQTYGADITGSVYSVTRVLFTYQSTGADGQPITIYARAYLPQTAQAPVLAMAPGTTGIDDTCAASLEQPTVHNWGNYQSQMLAYASQGYASVITDYEGMRDPGAIHHYMVGQLEGQAVLDSIRALKLLPQARGRIDTNNVFTAGYSQGGHAAFWADTLNAHYAPDVHLAGVIGWGPVMSVEDSLRGITQGSTLTWFGPNVLVSYADYYQVSFPLTSILNSPYDTDLTKDVLGHCIDTDIAFWGTNPAKVYTPQFVDGLKAGNLPADQFGPLEAEMQANQVGSEPTATPKLINQGQLDNVVLPTQAQAAMTRICPATRGPADLKLYPRSTHYTTMHDSFKDVLAWMNGIRNHEAPPSSC